MVKLNFNIRPSVLIFTLGLIGLVISLVEGPEEIGSKIPLFIFFVFIMCAGIVIEALPQKEDEIYGEMEGGIA